MVSFHVEGIHHRDRVEGGIPRGPETLGDSRDSEVADHDPFQRPPQTTA